MVLEVAILNIKSGLNEEFEQDFIKAKAIIEKMNGFKSISVKHCLENNNRYILLVEWDCLESHTEGFRKSKDYSEWKKLLHHYYSPFPIVEHYDREILD